MELTHQQVMGFVEAALGYDEGGDGDNGWTRDKSPLLRAHLTGVMPGGVPWPGAIQSALTRKKNDYSSPVIEQAHALADVLEAVARVLRTSGTNG